jgi:hypothetical protein
MLWMVTEPDHVRAQNNRAYYQQLIRDEEEERRKGDDGAPPIDSSVKNRRILDDYRQSEEFATYEALCRGETTHVCAFCGKLFFMGSVLYTDNFIFS